MGIFAVYDTVGIQNYIFASSKLAENVGASLLVSDIFNRFLPAVLKQQCNGHCIVNWENGGPLSQGTAAQAEIVYQGGGNAFVAYYGDDAENTFNKVTEALLRLVLEKTCGVVISVAAVQTEFGATYKEDYKALMNRLLLAKGNGNIPRLAGNQSITRQSKLTGLPVVDYKWDEWLDQSQIVKRERRNSVANAGLRQFDDLTLKDSFIGLIHADGNNMGNRISEIMSKHQNYDSAVPEIRALSAGIKRAYQNALEKTRAEYEAWFSLNYKERYEDGGKGLLYIEIIADGDDITVLTCGRHAISFASKLLRNIAIEPSPFDTPLSACAGVVIFHHHFPFAESYKLVEDCCGNAKKAARKIEGSTYLDFHLHQSGNVLKLSAIRDRQYTVGGKSIVARPWQITSEQSAEILNSIEWLEGTMDTWVNEKSKLSWPRSKQKDLRDAIGSGGNVAASRLKQAESRGLTLPQGLYQDKQNRTPVDGWEKYMFDILEIADVYEKIGEAPE